MKTLIRQHLGKIKAYSSRFLCCLRGDQTDGDRFFIYIVIIKQDLRKFSFLKEESWVGFSKKKTKKNTCLQSQPKIRFAKTICHFKAFPDHFFTKKDQ